ncbi:NrsF family protein [Sphingomonas mali]|uniref:NrsF family protein n=1 Tax=Sphingomonas mali TaxID=40682 RepID=UPI00082CE425|nr:DUF1109 domain-containing protein [Sphingomonas mali]
MKTEVLISQLSQDVQPVPRETLPRLLRAGLVAGGGAALFFVLVAPALGVRADLGVAAMTASFWIKLLYTVSIAGLAFTALERLSRPGGPAFSWMGLLWPPVTALAAIAAMTWRLLPGAEAETFWMGSSSWQCLVFVTALAVPVFAGLVWALSQLAPTRLRAAGAAAGLVAGATSASVYALHCAETSPGFVLLWYSLALAVAALLGAALGPRLLRW